MPSAAPDRSAGVSVVSVLYEPELPMQQMQARSLDRYLTGPRPDAVVLLDNTRRGLDDRARQALVAAHGELADRVVVLRPRDVAAVPLAAGWRTQQVLKLAVAEHVTSPHYVVLDAKNHLVAPTGLDVFTTADGRARTGLHGYRTHPLGPSLARVLRYCGLRPDDHLDRFTETTTPFVVDTARARAVVTGVAERSGRSFADEFVRESLTEFFLYTAWSLAQGSTLDELVEHAEPPAVTVWPSAGHTAGVTAALADVERTGRPFFAVHRRALATMDAEARGLLADFWVDRGLLAAEDGRAVVDSMAAGIDDHAKRSRVREAPVLALTAARKLRRELSARLR